MVGVYVIPDFAVSTPGQMPRLDARIDAGYAGLVDPLVAPAATDVFIDSLLERAMGATNELTMRQEVMSSLLQEHVAPNDRRSILARAVALYRSTRAPARGTKVVVRDGWSEVGPEFAASLRVSKGGKGDGAHLRSEIRRRVAAAGQLGLDSKKLHDLVQRWGAPAVTAALRGLGTEVHSSRIFLKSDSLCERIFIKAEPEQLPRGAHSIGGVDDPRSDPVGARKIWNKRVVEKKPDGRWHVVGTVAGLEDPKSVPQLDVSMLTREHLLHLLKQLLRIKAAGHDAREEA